MKTKLFLTVLTSTQLSFAASLPACGSYVAHEWGTFTSVQGADGVQTEWNPLVTSELPQFVYRHEWREGDLVIWDNRCTMHRGRAFDEHEVRDLRRVTTRDISSTLDQTA